jgi:hypothetical protein
MGLRLGSGNSFAEIHFDRISGQPGLGHVRLFVGLIAQIREQPEDSQTEIGGFSGSLLVQGFDGNLGHVATLYPHDPPLVVEAYPNSSSRGFVMVADLDRGRVEAIESIRAGKGLRWSIRLGARVFHGGRSQSVGGELPFETLGAQWLEVLESANYSKALLLEVPLAVDAPRALKRALKHLASANDSRLSGDWRNAVGLCRESIEALTRAFPAVDSQASFEFLRRKSKDERMLVLRRALTLLPHAAKHDDPEEAEITWTRQDAETIVAMTASLIQWYARR